MESKNSDNNKFHELFSSKKGEVLFIVVFCVLSIVLLIGSFVFVDYFVENSFVRIDDKPVVNTYFYDEEDESYYNNEEYYDDEFYYKDEEYDDVDVYDIKKYEVDNAEPYSAAGEAVTVTVDMLRVDPVTYDYPIAIVTFGYTNNDLDASISEFSENVSVEAYQNGVKLEEVSAPNIENQENYNRKIEPGTKVGITLVYKLNDRDTSVDFEAYARASHGDKLLAVRHCML